MDGAHHRGGRDGRLAEDGDPRQDRKSTRLNSSHSQISYAVFCLKKKTERPAELGQSLRQQPSGLALLHEFPPFTVGQPHEPPHFDLAARVLPSPTHRLCACSTLH